MSQERSCPICSREDATRGYVNSAVAQNPGGSMTNTTHADDAWRWSCKRCGDFVVTSCDDANLRSGRDRRWDPYQLSSLVAEQHYAGLPAFWLRDGMDPYGPIRDSNNMPVNVAELLSRWPRSVPERLDRTLCTIARMSRFAGESVQLIDNLESVTFARNPGEAYFHTSALHEQGFITKKYETLDPSRPALQPMCLTLTARGWARFDELTRATTSRNNPAFVAMWFGSNSDEMFTPRFMSELYERAISPAIKEAGYRAIRVDLVEHTGFIMDRVLSLIRVAPFVVADFTGNRNGVYFEAGFARGLGLPVVHLCHQSHFEQSHFDIKQINTLVWNDHGDLTGKLKYRILGTLGAGPHGHEAGSE